MPKIFRNIFENDYICTMLVNELIVDGVMLGGVLKGFFFFFGGTIQLPDDEFEDFINNDNLKPILFKEPSLSIFFSELEKIKNDFRSFLKTDHQMNPSLANRICKAYVFRIKKMRLIIDFKTYISFNRDHKGDKYLVGRSYWFDFNGKQIKKFAKVFGREDEIKIKGKIPSKILDQLEKDLRGMMWNLYQKEYYGSK